MQQLIERLKQGNESEEDIYDRRAYLAHLLRNHVKDNVESQAEAVFRRKLDRGEIRFDLETAQPNYCMVRDYVIQLGPNDKPLLRDYKPVQLTLFEPVFDREFDSELEKDLPAILMKRKRCDGGIAWRRVNKVSTICKAGNRDAFTLTSLR